MCENSRMEELPLHIYNWKSTENVIKSLCHNTNILLKAMV